MSSHEEIFYNNVYLLTQAEPRSKEFDTLFLKDMFRKQNTPGFVHISHFLLNIYDSNLCKKLLPWPCICKQDETKFRKKFIEFLEIIQVKNPDFLFPSGVASCLFLATGTKFMIIMKLLSIIVLRSYIQKNADEDVYIPSYSPNINKKFLKDLYKLAEHKAKQVLEDEEKDHELAVEFIKSRQEEINTFKSKIQEKELDLANLVKNAPINVEEDKKKLLNYNHNEDVVESWHKTITDTIEYIKEGITITEKLNNLLKDISEMIDLLIYNPNILDGNSLPKIDVNSFSDLLDPESQVIAHRLYENNELVLTNFLTIFNKIFSQLWNQFLKIDFSSFDLLGRQLEASSEDLQNMVKIISTIQNNCSELRSTIETKKVVDMSLEFPNQHQLNDDLSLISSPISVQRLSEKQKMEHEKKIYLTPIIKSHDDLFSKYKIQPSGLDTFIPKNDQIIRINLDDSIQSCKSNSIFMHKQEEIKKPTKANSEVHQRYHRFFKPMIRRLNESKLSSLSMLSLPKANSTAVMNIISEEQNLTNIASCSNDKSTTKQTEHKRKLCKQEFEDDKQDPPKIVINSPIKETNSYNRRASIGEIFDKYNARFSDFRNKNSSTTK